MPRVSRPTSLPLHTFLVLLPICAAAGPFLFPFSIGFGQLYAFRLAAIGGIVVILLASPWRYSGAPVVSTPLLFAAGGWMLWGISSLLWTPDPLAGLVELVSVVLGFLATAELILAVSDRYDRFRLLTTGWACAFVGVSLIAGWEVLTGRHLETSFSNAMAIRDTTLFATATFGNPNALGAFLLMVVVIFLWRTVETRSIWRRLAWIGGIAIALALMVLGGCRTAMVGSMVCTGIFVWAYGTIRQRVWVLLAVLAGCAAALWLVSDLTGLSLNDLLMTWRIGGELQYGGSAGVRLNLFRDGWEMLKGTWGMGVGAGGFVYAIEHGYGRYDTAGIVNPHNFWLEIGAQYGLLVLLVICLALSWLVIVLAGSVRSARIAGDREALALAALGLTSVAAYVIGAGSNSSYIPQPINWTFLGTIGAMIAVGVAERGRAELGGANESGA